MLNELADQTATSLRMIPFPPLAVALLLAMVGVFGRGALSRRTVTVVAVGGLAASFIASVIAFSELVFAGEANALIDRVAIWIGAGVGSSALIGDLALRLDTLSAAFSLVISGVGLLLVFYVARLPELLASAEVDAQRFFGLASLQVGMSLLFVLADNLLLLMLAFLGVGLASALLAGFRHVEVEASRLGGRVLMAGRVGEVALLVASLLLFRALADADAPGTGLAHVRALLLGLEGGAAALPVLAGSGGAGLLDAIGLCLLVAAASVLAQLAFFAGSSADSAAPLPGSALMQTVTGMAVAGYLVVRFGFLFAEAPLAAAAMTGLGAAAAFAGAVLACRVRGISAVLAWSSVSQLGLVLVASGLGAQTAAVFQLISHAFFKGLLLMAAGVVVVAVKGELDLTRMGNLGSRLTLTRIGFWIGAFSLAGGLPLTAGFFSIQQVVIATRAADPGLAYGLIYPGVLLTLALTAFYIVRLILLSLYGDTRLPSDVHWDEVEDPEPGILWAMGGLAALSILGAVIGFPQFWADFFFDGDIERSNSLHYFLAAGVDPGPETTLDAGQTWAVSGWTVLMTVLGFAAAILGYAVRPAGLVSLVHWPQRMWDRAASRLPALPSLPAGWRGLVGARFRAVLGVRDHDRALAEPEPQRTETGLLRVVADHLIKQIQSGFVQHSLALSVTGSLALLAYFLWAGGH